VSTGRRRLLIIFLSAELLVLGTLSYLTARLALRGPPPRPDPFCRLVASSGLVDPVDGGYSPLEYAQLADAEPRLARWFAEALVAPETSASTRWRILGVLRRLRGTQAVTEVGAIVSAWVATGGPGGEGAGEFADSFDAAMREMVLCSSLPDRECIGLLQALCPDGWLHGLQVVADAQMPAPFRQHGTPERVEAFDAKVWRAQELLELVADDGGRRRGMHR
jgi:hypothetical protein